MGEPRRVAFAGSTTVKLDENERMPTFDGSSMLVISYLSCSMKGLHSLAAVSNLIMFAIISSTAWAT